MIVQDLVIRRDSERNYRKRGLGTSLLNLAINRAKTKGKKHVYGSIVQVGIVKTPDLIQFYEKRGFVKCANYPGCLPNAVAYLCMDID